jgi:hypothetical protein
MTTSLLHPATAYLLRLQSRGRRRRIWRRFCQTRRLILSAIACVLAVVWLGNAALTVWLRESASVETLRVLLSTGLVFYAGWHFAKAAFFRPESPFDWSTAERDILAAMPLEPRELVAYQLASVTVTTLLKSALLVVLLLPDLRCLPLGFLGVLLAMLILEMLRMAIEIATWGMSRASFLAYRAAVLAGLLVAGFAIVKVIVHQAVARGPIVVGERILQPLLDILVQLKASLVGYATVPFRPLVDLILAERISTTSAMLAAAALATTAALGAGVIALHAGAVRLVARQERRNYQPAGAPRGLPADFAQNEPGRSPVAARRPRLTRIPRWGGAGALAWRQLVGARRRWGSLLTAMIAPAVLALGPCFMIGYSQFAFLVTTGTLAFYTFLLLPTALRFDFRRDLDRMTTLKGLPVSPAAVVIGQTLAPVVIATVFQLLVLSFAAIARSVPAHFVLAAMLVMTPLNVLVFALDNLIYLLYPHRVQQEGLEIFVRTMLTFTGKGLLFTVGLLLLTFWAGVALPPPSQGAGNTNHETGLFVAGMIAGPALIAGFVLYALCRTYRHLDAVEDIPQ